MSENTLNFSIQRRMGFKAAAHGMRATFSTWANANGYNPDCIEKQLAYKDKDTTRRAYNRGDYWDDRVKLLQD